MGYLTRNDVASVRNCAVTLYSNATSPDFLLRAAMEVSKVIPSLRSGFFKADVMKNSASGVNYPVGSLSASVMKDFIPIMRQYTALYIQANHHMPYSPAEKMKMQVRKPWLRQLAAGEAVRISDAQPRGRRLKMEIYNEVFRKIGCQYMLQFNFNQSSYGTDAVVASDSPRARRRCFIGWWRERPISRFQSYWASAD
ncbi:MAG: hypothetical protein HY280_00995 [Nitrospinae bacterium]|nr:hypothetical protein [Nitrospinota bacterium]